MKKTLLILIVFLPSSIAFPISLKSTDKLTKEQAKAVLATTLDISYQKVVPANLLAESYYIEMAKEGWNGLEIIRLTDQYLEAHKPELKAAGSQIDYKKNWKPFFMYGSIMNGNVSDFNTTPKQRAKIQANIEATQVDANASYPRILYSVNDRLSKVRNSGYFRHNAILPASGRIYWLTVNPDNPDKIMIVADGDGIWRTDNMGKHWECITDRIPNRYDRNYADSYSIPVDPDNWDHIFAFMANSTVYETTNAGQSWRKITGAAHKGFKRGYCFRDDAGNLKFIGARPTSPNSTSGLGLQLWLSSDTCKTWKSVALTSTQYDNTVNGTPGFWFQEIGFHPTDRNVLFSAGSRGILKSTDAGATWQRMTFKVYGTTTAVVRVESTNVFPLATANAPMFLAINPSNPNEMWAALSSRSNANYCGLYKSSDGGVSWITVHEPSAVPAIGSGQMFGNESAWNWLGGFAVNYVDQRYVYGTTTNSGHSTDGGVSYVDYLWYARHKGFYPDGNLYTTSSCTHNTDNHYMFGHKSGRIFRIGDTGILVKDKNINGYEWTNITGDMGENLFYASSTNEIGDYDIVGNTQDLNAQTYRGGRWGIARGYEGGFAMINPFSGEEHFTGGCNGRTDLQNISYGGNFTKTAADFSTGNWFLLRDVTNPDGSRFSVIKDFGKTSLKIDNSSGFVTDFAISRDVPGGKLFIVKNNKLYVSTNSGATFNQINTGSLAPTKVAVNPTNSNEIYMAKDGAVYSTINGGASWQTISTIALNGVGILRLIYHEGSGDLYVVSPSNGIFIREAGTTDWLLWGKGYNKAKFVDAQLNYTSQEMIITDYGRGIWVADLQHPADRFLKGGFALKQISNTNNIRTFGIAVTYTIPMYYYYKWYVNGVLQTTETGQYFSTSTLQPNDKVKLEVTLRESPDITTASADFIVADETTTSVVNTRGNYIYSNQRGRVDLGYVDQFFGNFTLQMWVNPKSDGVILANRQVNTNSVKGFYMAITSGALSFNYTPENNFEQPFNETTKTMHYSINAGAIALNTWSQITVTHNRTGNIQIYVNGILKASQTRAMPAFTLNNGVYLSLFADGYEYNPIDASVDEFKIWNGVLDATSIRKSMFGSIQPANIKEIYYNDFNALNLAEQKERYSQKGMSPRVTAQVSVLESTTGICATGDEYKQVTSTWTPFMKNGLKAMELRSVLGTYLPNVSGLIYDGSFLGTNSSITSAYYSVYPTAYGVKLFDVSDFTKLMDVKFYLDPAQAETFKDASIYTVDLTAAKENWTLLAPLVYDATDQSVSLTGVKASDINNKRLLIAKAKPSMVLSSNSINVDKELYVYTADTVKVPFMAGVAGGFVAPTASYLLTANNPVVTKIDPLTFTNNVASSFASVALADNEMCNQRTDVSIVGEDASLMPYNFTVVNKIAPRTNPYCVKLNNGGANVGSGTTFAAMSGKNTATYMAWVRLDDATMLTGYKMILFFRGSTTGASGLALKDGKVGCHWNNESWSWDVNSGHVLTTADLGKWVHIAMTASPSGLNFYLNGKKGITCGSGLSGPAINSALMLGKNVDTDANFIGAIDQASVWNRTLTDAEIAKCMHSRSYLNETGLVSYVTFDKEADGGGYVDLKSNAVVSFNGTVLTKQPAYFPYSSMTQQVRTKTTDDAKVTDGVGFTFPASYPTANKYYTTNYKGVPYNATDPKYPKLVSLEAGYRTISMGAIYSFTATDRMQFTVENASIVAGDSIIFYARPLGTVTSFKRRYGALAQTGKASFDVPASIFNENLVYMFYRLPVTTAVDLPTEAHHYQLTVDNGVCIIRNLRGNAKITIFDMTGRAQYSKQSFDNTCETELPKGIYVVRIEELGSVCMTKISM